MHSWNAELAEASQEPANTRRVTNIGTFRAYVEHYLRQHAGINQEMTQLVRQLSPTPDGLPLELYCFTNTTAWSRYEAINPTSSITCWPFFRNLVCGFSNTKWRGYARIETKPAGYDPALTAKRAAARTAAARNRHQAQRLLSALKPFKRAKNAYKHQFIRLACQLSPQRLGLAL